MSLEAATKVTAGHLARTAYLYVRQSTLRQVMTNTESATRQYGLRQRAVAMGWAAEQIVVIDCDQGQSGSSAVDREGFQRLAAEVGMGRAGIVLGLEVSRLARNNADWHRLLELCALGATLICDEDGLYDPCDFNDRLLLGLKGTMSEAELHFIRARSAAAFSPRPSAVSSSSPFQSGSSMTPPITSCSTPTPVCNTRSVISSPPLPAPARPGPWCRPSPPKGSSSPCECDTDQPRENSLGSRWPTGGSCAPCTTLATPEPSSSAVTVGVPRQAARPPWSFCPETSGSP